MTTPNDDDLAFQRAVEARLHPNNKGKKTEKRDTSAAPKESRDSKSSDNSAEGIVPIIAQFFAAATEATVALAKASYKVIRPVVRPFVWVGSKLVKGTVWSFKAMSLKKDPETGEKHFNLRFFVKNAAIVAAATAIGVTVLPRVVKPIAMGAYYYSTQHTYKDVYVGNAGVFVNQQFDHANQAGKHVASRDEIYTVLGRHTPNGKEAPMRFDIDTNLYFAYHTDSLRPDLAAAKIVPQSPYGAKCDFQTTGIYNRLPRFFRTEAVKWWDLRSHIVQVIDCKQLDQNYQPIDVRSYGPGSVTIFRPSVSVPMPSAHP